AADRSAQGCAPARRLIRARAPVVTTRWRESMRTLSTASFVVIALALGALATSAERLRAHYEINVAEGTDLKRIQSTSEVTSGKPIEFDLAKYKLALQIDVGEASAYVLTVSLAPSASPSEVFVKKTFHGSRVSANVGPLEFEVEQNGVKVSGAIALSA